MGGETDTTSEKSSCSSVAFDSLAASSAADNRCQKPRGVRTIAQSGRHTYLHSYREKMPLREGGSRHAIPRRA